MHDRFITKNRSPWLNGNLWAVAVLLLIGIRFWLGPEEFRGPLDACLVALLAIAGLLGGDRWGFTESPHRGVRLLGRIIVTVFAALLLIAAYRVLVGK